MYARSFLCEEAKIKQRTPLKKERCEIGEEAIWESRFTSFFLLDPTHLTDPNRYLADFDPSNEKSCLMYFDVNNLYCVGMIQHQIPSRWFLRVGTRAYRRYQCSR